MGITPKIMTGKVMHKRFFPKENGFTYGIYYLCLPLQKIADLDFGRLFGINRAGLMGFNVGDHGPRDRSSLETWIRSILHARGLDKYTDGGIELLAMPRVFGHVFNPVSFWLCRDAAGALKAVLCEVNNTFGETHSYLCFKQDYTEIAPSDWMEAEKVFHVSPFLEREGRYKFRFDCRLDAVGVWIDYYAADGRKQLSTALNGKLIPLDRRNLWHVFWKYPLVSLVALFRIHLHAFRLFRKRIKYVPKPVQKADKIT